MSFCIHCPGGTDGTLCDLKLAKDQCLLAWLQKSSVWITKHEILAEEYVQIAWFNHAHKSLTRRDDAAVELKACCQTDLPIQIAPRTAATMMKNKKFVFWTVVVEVAKKDAPEWWRMLQEITPNRTTATGANDTEYEADLLSRFPHTRHWLSVPFSPNRECSEMVLHSLYRTQNMWEKECFCLPVARIEGDIYHHVPVASGSHQTVPIIQWLLQQHDASGEPYLRNVEQANGYKYFFVTTFQQCQGAKAWVDNLCNKMDKTFTVEQRLAIFNSELSSLRPTNQGDDESQQTPVDQTYFEALQRMVGNSQDFPALDAKIDQ